MKSTWPDLSSCSLEPTLATLHLWSQIPGKVRLALTPWENHGWHVPLYLSPRGLTTGTIPLAGNALALEFDLVAGALRVSSSRNGERTLELTPQSTAEFYRRVTDALRQVGAVVALNTTPSEMADVPCFDADHEVRALDLDVARTYWRALLETQRVFQRFRTRFTGKHSPIHFFWGAFDLAVTRFSGRAAPAHPGGIVRLADAVAREAYCHEVSSAGLWPNLGGADGPCFYNYAYPSPNGFAEARVMPSSAKYDAALGEFLLPYRSVQAAEDPDAELMAFLQSTYDAAADLGHWDRDTLERPAGTTGRPPAGS